MKRGVIFLLITTFNLALYSGCTSLGKEKQKTPVISDESPEASIKLSYNPGLDNLIKRLGNNTEYWAAREAYEILWDDFLYRKESPDTIQRLKLNIINPDHQTRQLSNMLLVRYYLEKEYSPKLWEKQVYVNLIEGLRNDNIRNHNFGLPANGRLSVYAFVKIGELAPIDILLNELENGDIQSKEWCSEILTRYYYNKKDYIPSLGRYCFEQLRHDVYANAFDNYDRLSILGKDRFIKLLAEIKDVDWQQGALLQCLCAKFDIEWSPPENIIREWTVMYSFSEEHIFCGKSNGIKQAGLYLNPRTLKIMKMEELPVLARIMYELEDDDVFTLKEKYEYVYSWFSFLHAPEKPHSSYEFLFY